ncbi:MAG: hypothetical protein HC777_00410 [Hyphomonadaceae bacterium]|nr:hypothetical protein [Hyphomonadaceae bacterium]
MIGPTEHIPPPTNKDTARGIFANSWQTTLRSYASHQLTDVLPSIVLRDYHAGFA